MPRTSGPKFPAGTMSSVRRPSSFGESPMYLGSKSTADVSAHSGGAVRLHRAPNSNSPDGAVTVGVTHSSRVSGNFIA